MELKLKPLQRLTPKNEGTTSPKARVLYIEDEDANWDTTEGMLGKQYDLHRAKTAAEAFDILATQTFDMILVDIQLGGSDLDGIEIVRALKGGRIDHMPKHLVVPRLKVVPWIVFVTAYGSKYSRDSLILIGGNDMVTKPVDFTNLTFIMARLFVASPSAGE